MSILLFLFLQQLGNGPTMNMPMPDPKLISGRPLPAPDLPPGTVSVSPSRGCPGAKRYLSGSFAPAMSMNSGNCSSVTAAAAWRIKASRVRNSRRGSATSTSRRQRSNAAVVQIASGIRSA